MWNQVQNTHKFVKSQAKNHRNNWLKIGPIYTLPPPSPSKWMCTRVFDVAYAIRTHCTLALSHCTKYVDFIWAEMFILFKIFVYYYFQPKISQCNKMINICVIKWRMFKWNYKYNAKKTATMQWNRKTSNKFELFFLELIWS